MSETQIKMQLLDRRIRKAIRDIFPESNASELRFHLGIHGASPEFYKAFDSEETTMQRSNTKWKAALWEKDANSISSSLNVVIFK